MPSPNNQGEDDPICSVIGAVCQDLDWCPYQVPFQQVCFSQLQNYLCFSQLGLPDFFFFKYKCVPGKRCMGIYLMLDVLNFKHYTKN